MVKAVRKAQQLMAAPAFDKIRGEALYQSDETDEDIIRENIRNRADTIYHPVGTCKMGSDSMAVVDQRLRVKGIGSLRVIDASIMPSIVSGNTNAPSIMIGEKGRCDDFGRCAVRQTGEKMSIQIEPTGQACGAFVRNIDLTAALSDETVSEINAAWAEHHVLVFPDQPMSDDDLERFTSYFGPFGDDPFIKPVEGREHIIAVQRKADEATPIFAEALHSDWSFQETPPIGTCLFSIKIPPTGGDTLFSNQQKALAEMPNRKRKKFEKLTAVHSAAAAYGPKGYLGEDDQAAGRSMEIISSDEALETVTHPLVKQHPVSGVEGFFGSYGYIVGLEGKGQLESALLLNELLKWQSREEFLYRHKWEKDMLVMWDNRSVLHAASGGL